MDLGNLQLGDSLSDTTWNRVYERKNYKLDLVKIKTFCKGTVKRMEKQDTGLGKTLAMI